MSVCEWIKADECLLSTRLSRSEGVKSAGKPAVSSRIRVFTQPTPISNVPVLVTMAVVYGFSYLTCAFQASRSPGVQQSSPKLTMCQNEDLSFSSRG